MKSNWIAMKPNAAPQTDRSDLMRKIYELIDWYEDNSTRKEDDFIKAKLKSVIHLAENVENSEDIMFIEEIVQTFGDIIRKQRVIIRELEEESEFLPLGQDFDQQSFLTSYVTPIEGFTNDDQIKNAFSAYMKNEGKSSFTTNDYILRVQNLWQNFEHEFRTRQLEEDLLHLVSEEQISLEYPLLNAYRHINALNKYVALNMEKNAGDRNWANIRAAINTFGKGVCGEEYKKVKVPRETSQGKDFSKYLFEGKTYGKSRLVLAVVQKYVEDHHPTTFEEIEKAFPSSLQGSLGVVKRIEDVSDKYKGEGKGNVKRYFIKEDETIRLSSGEQVIVCTQWGASNTKEFVKNAVNKLGYEIRKIEQ